jgi:protein-L-isoaspartate(D-aspartate) O-methyltransferase
MIDFSEARTHMVNTQVITLGVTDRRLIAALSAVPRERFLPVDMEPFAYADLDLPLNRGALTSSPPRHLMAVGVFARLIQEGNIGSDAMVLDVGCTTGYSSAVLARLATSVIGLECDEHLAASAVKNLLDLEVDHASVVTGPLERGWPADAPYDLIILEGAVGRIPAVFGELLKIGGRLVGVVGYGHSASAMVYTKSRFAISGRRAFNAAVRPLPGFEIPKAFVF